MTSEHNPPFGSVVRSRIGTWTTNILTGLADHTLATFEWILLYGFIVSGYLAVVLVLEHRLEGILLFYFGTAWTIEILGYALVWRINAHLPTRTTGQVIALAVVVASAAACTALISESGLVDANLLASTLVGGIGAWLIATIFVGLVLVVAGTALNSDLASMRMFAGRRFLFDLFFTLFLFTVTFATLSIWPVEATLHGVTSEGSNAVSPTAPAVGRLILLIANPTTPLGSSGEGGLACFGAVGAILIFFLATFSVYWAIASKLDAGIFAPLQLMGNLIADNFAYRFGGKARPLWPHKQGFQYNDQKNYDQLRHFSLTANFSAITLAFGLWAPLVFRVELAKLASTELDHQINWLAVVVLVLYLAGGVDIWYQTVDISGNAGTTYAFGYWLGTGFTYFATLLLPIVIVSTAPVVQNWLIAGIDPTTQVTTVVFQTMESGLILTYRALLAVATLFVALLQMRGAAPLLPISRIRDALALVALLALLGFVLAPSSFPVATDAHFFHLAQPWSGLVLAVLAGLGLTLLTKLPRIRGLRKHHARLVASSSLAIVPLLLSERVLLIERDGESLCLVVKNPADGAPPIRLSLELVGSEDEAAFETNRWFRALWRGRVDFLITDIQTAIGVQESHKRRVGHWLAQKDEQCEFEMFCVVGTIPWYQFDAVGRLHNSKQEELQLRLDTGSIRYNPPKRPTDGRRFPRGVTKNTRWSSADIVALYATKNNGDVADVSLPEPYFSWAARTINNKPGQSVQNEKSLLTPYVLLSRNKQERARLSQNIVRLVYEMILEGQIALERGAGVLDHARLQPMFDTLRGQIDPRLDISLADVKLGILRSKYIPELLPNSQPIYEWILKDLIDYGFFKSTPARQTMQTGLRETESQQGAASTPARGQESSPEATDFDVLEALEHANPRIVDKEYFTGATRLMKYKRATSTIVGDDHITPQKYEDVVEDMRALQFDLRAIPVPNHSGELRQLVAKKPTLLPASLPLLASSSLGDSVLVYVINPGVGGTVTLPSGLTLLKNNGEPEQRYRISALEGSEPGSAFLGPSIPALIAEIDDEGEGLSGLLQKINVNIELAFTVRRPGNKSLLVFVVDEPNLVRIWLAHNSLDSNEIQYLPKSPFTANEGDVDSSFLWDAKPQIVDFSLPNTHDFYDLDWKYRFTCGTGGTWTMMRGDSGQWDVNLGFDTLELLIPRELWWRGAFYDLFSRLGGKPIVRWLKGLRLLSAGTEGLAFYRNKANWQVEIQKQRRNIE